MHSVVFSALSLSACAPRLNLPVTARMATAWPVTYSPYSEPRQLTDAQLREIRAVVERVDVKNREVWFAHVHFSREGTYRSTVYLVPDTFDSRVRHGECFDVENVIPVETLRSIMKRGGINWPEPAPYVQVVPSSDAGRGAKPPADEQMPFSPVEGLTDRELVAVVEVARSAFALEGIHESMPIQRIEIETLNSIRVYFGWLAGPLYGRGHYVDVTRKSRSFSAGTVGMWVS